MTTTTLSHRAASRTRGSYGFRTVAQMEWQKLRTVRSTWYIVAIFAAGMTGLAMLVLSHENYAQMSAADRASFDPPTTPSSTQWKSTSAASSPSSACHPMTPSTAGCSPSSPTSGPDGGPCAPAPGVPRPNCPAPEQVSVVGGAVAGEVLVNHLDDVPEKRDVAELPGLWGTATRAIGMPSGARGQHRFSTRPGNDGK